MKLLLTVLLAALTSVTVDSSNVLMVLPLGSKSHKNIFVPLAESLSSRGHKVSIASFYASSSTNSSSLAYEDVVATQAFDTVKAVTGGFDVFKMRNTKGGNVNHEIFKKVVQNIGEYCEAFLKDPAVSHLWETEPDVVLLPAFMNECGLAFVHKFKAPFIYVTTSGLTPWTSDLVGNPENPAYIPNQYLPYTSKMTLIERTINTIMRVVAPPLRKRVILDKLEGVIQRVLGDSSVSLERVEQNVSLILVNSHHSMGFSRPLLPNIVEVGGMHCKPAVPLHNIDPELASFISKGHGAILFSLGSHIKSSQIPSDVLNVLVNAFSKLPYQVVWKWEGTPPKGLPSNVITRAWIPQQDLLGHSAVKAFFTHGGLLSLQEAVFHGVPIVGLPLMSDQHLNVQQAVLTGVGKEVTLETLTSKRLVETLREVIENPSYRQSVKERSLIMKDQETTPLNRAVYWTEYVIRHNGAHHLKSTATSLSWYQYYLLDVLLVFATIAIVFIFILYLVVKSIVKKMFKTAKNLFHKVSKLLHDEIVSQIKVE